MKERKIIVDTGSDLFAMAVSVGRDRFNDSKQRQDRAGAKKSLKDDLMGAVAEAYMAYSIKQKWHASVGQFRGQQPDVGLDVEVRHTHHRNGGLILRPGEPTDRRYALAIASYPIEWANQADATPDSLEIRLIGWMWGHEMKQDKRLKKPDPNRPECWLVPQSELRDLNELDGGADSESSGSL